MTKFSVCVTKGHKWLVLWPTFVALHALSNGMHEIRDEIFVDLLVLLVYEEKKTNMKKQETSPMHVWSRFITIVYGSNRYDSHIIMSID